MNSSIRLPVVVEESDFDFVILGPAGGKRALLVRGGRPDLVLLGAAKTASIPKDEPPAKGARPEPGLEGLYPKDPAATIFLVHALLVVDHHPHARLEPFTLAWVGYRGSADLAPIRSYFRSCVPPLHATLNGTASEDIPWLLASLLYSCARATASPRFPERAWAVGKRILSTTVSVFFGTFAFFLLLVAFNYLLGRK